MVWSFIKYTRSVCELNGKKRSHQIHTAQNSVEPEKVQKKDHTLLYCAVIGCWKPENKHELHRSQHIDETG
jgi:hypothetical protein